MVKLIKQVTANHVLLTIIGSLLLWIGTQTQRSYQKSDDAVDVVHAIEMAFVTKSYKMDSVSSANKDEVIDSLQVVKQMIEKFGIRADTVDKVYYEAFIPLVKKVGNNTGRISILEDKVKRIERFNDMTSFEKIGIK